MQNRTTVVKRFKVTANRMVDDRLYGKVDSVNHVWMLR